MSATQDAKESEMREAKVEEAIERFENILQLNDAQKAFVRVNIELLALECCRIGYNSNYGSMMEILGGTE